MLLCPEIKMPEIKSVYHIVYHVSQQCIFVISFPPFSGLSTEDLKSLQKKRERNRDNKSCPLPPLMCLLQQKSNDKQIMLGGFFFFKQ